MNISQHAKNQINKIARNNVRSRRQNQRAQLARINNAVVYSQEWMILLNHFYGKLIRDGHQIKEFYSMTMKDFQILAVLHTRMILSDLEQSRKAKKEKEAREEKRLLEMLKRQK